MKGVINVLGSQHCALSNGDIVQVDKYSTATLGDPTQDDVDVWCVGVGWDGHGYYKARNLRKLPEQELIEAAKALCKKWDIMSPDWYTEMSVRSEFDALRKVLKKCEYKDKVGRK